MILGVDKLLKLVEEEKLVENLSKESLIIQRVLVLI